jgi:hypothetical protein
VQTHRRGPPRPIAVAASRDDTRIALEEAGEAAKLLASGTPLPIEAFADVVPSLDLSTRGGALDGVALR